MSDEQDYQDYLDYQEYQKAQQPAAPQTQEVSWPQAAKFVGKSLAEGAGNILDLGQSFVAPGTGMRHDVGDAVKKYIGTPEDTGVRGDVADYGKAAIEASEFPIGGGVSNVISALGSELAHKIYPESKVAPVAGALLGGGGASLFNRGAEGAISAGKAFERGSLGTGVRNYLSSQRSRGLLEDSELGETGTRLSQAISEIGDTEGFGLLRSPQRLQQRNKAVLDAVGGKIGSALDAADAAGANPNINVGGPGSAVAALIDKSHATKADLKDAFQEFMNKFYDPQNGWDGTVKGLNDWKSTVAKFGFTGSARGVLPGDVGRSLKRAIASDLGDAVDGAVTSSGAAKPEEWKNLMRTYSNHAEIRPVVDPEVARDLASSWDKGVKGAIRTSGGVATPIIAGGTMGGPGGAALGALVSGATLAAGSRTGRGIMGSLLKTGGRIGRAGTENSLFSPAAGIVPSLFNGPSAPEKESPSVSLISDAGADVPPNEPRIGRKLTTTTPTTDSYRGTQDKWREDKRRLEGLGFPADEPSTPSSKITPKLLDAVRQVESSGGKNNLGPDTKYGRAEGPYQLIEKFAKPYHSKLGLSGEYDPYNEKQSRKIASAMLEDNLKWTNGDLVDAVTAYHSGINNVRRKKLGPEGRAYAKRVFTVFRKA